MSTQARAFIRDANGKIQGNPKGYTTLKGAKMAFNRNKMQVLLLDIGHAKMQAYLKENPSYGGFNLIELGSYRFEEVTK